MFGNNTGGNTRVTNSFLTLWFDHGANPNNEDYSYVLLPNKSSLEVAGYAANPDITVVENTYEAQAVRENKLGITAVNFWNDAEKSTGGIKSFHKASVMMKEAGDELSLSVADPTHKNAGTIELELDRATKGVIEADPRVTVTRQEGKTKISIRVNGSEGSAIMVRLKLPNVQYILDEVNRYSQSGDIHNSVGSQLTNKLTQALHHRQAGRGAQAIEHLDDAMKLLGSANPKHVPEPAKAALEIEIRDLTEHWSR